eukprot:scaffold2018_cov113-Cylindrotheca_fusiformis.AAC.6
MSARGSACGAHSPCNATTVILSEANRPPFQFFASLATSPFGSKGVWAVGWYPLWAEGRWPWGLIQSQVYLTPPNGQQDRFFSTTVGYHTIATTRT